MHHHIPRDLVNGPRVDRSSHQSRLQKHTQFLALAIRYDYSQSIFPGPATSYSSINPSDEITIELTNAWQIITGSLYSKMAASMITKWTQNQTRTGRWESKARESINTHCWMFHSRLLTLNYSSVWPSAVHIYCPLLSGSLWLQSPCLPT